ncbi:low temperature requirement protein A [Parasedimentitalea marina]|uniref:Low temperature requirement protein A n=1 Tax=Parasedimentitalea marina TaxID=2483033 RepID=A0A3T0N7D5_9RHOB|nr:low temperature requirement protein A [Parasedimentitalea marina]AZV79899.1 low temperature requirement protein A [Parasedimentitalea marina]
MPNQVKFRLAPRDRHETHRAATPLELMFDLASVIAIATAATGLHHAVAHSHFADGVVGFFFAFFMIWLAWMNYTWFASAYDNGHRWFQIISMAIMFGSLVLAAGIPAVFAGEPLFLVLIGFIIMRLGLVVLWLAAAQSGSGHRETSLRYAGGIAALQVFWVAIILMIPATSAALKWAFLLGFAMELAVPVFSEGSNRTAWHKHHIIERYGLLNIIVLGECFLAVVMAIKGEGGLPSWQLLEIGLLASIITFALWALYFNGHDHLPHEEKNHVLIWGYGHFTLFASGAATGAGFAVMVDFANHSAHLSETAAALSVAIPVSLYVMSVWLVRDRYWLVGGAQFVMPGCAVAVLLAAFFASSHVLLLIAAVLIGTLIIRTNLGANLAVKEK